MTSPCAAGTRRVKQLNGMLNVNKRSAIAFATACLQPFEFTAHAFTRLMVLSMKKILSQVAGIMSYFPPARVMVLS